MNEETMVKVNSGEIPNTMMRRMLPLSTSGPRGQQHLHYFKVESKAPRNLVKTTFVMIHGLNRRRQSCMSWEELPDFFSRFGMVLALDLLGHGHSLPGAAHGDINQPYDVELQVDAVLELLSVEAPNDGKLVFVGRSYGGYVSTKLCEGLKGSVLGLVLIAPMLENKEEFAPILENLPIFLMWAKEDMLIPFENSQLILGNCRKVQTLFIDRINVPEDVRSKPSFKFMSHSPEITNKEEFSMQVTPWLREILKFRGG
eukprot:CAMPEP_0119133498 /NCGR_PEP_ID=MMETSP1310-20130426/13406_1 /TAXON_ID=464262 /ORGANISM="Genus nov. species nov., Strain RCC2339" /LENGTH=256 /DNA_ID=CAMNT_0007124191 /DNA_START=43 /DNA_END=810 /DNA_ORIENTATION=+